MLKQCFGWLDTYPDKYIAKHEKTCDQWKNYDRRVKVENCLTDTECWSIQEIWLSKDFLRIHLKDQIRITSINMVQSPHRQFGGLRAFFAHWTNSRQAR